MKVKHACFVIGGPRIFEGGGYVLLAVNMFVGEEIGYRTLLHFKAV